jgi:phage FluMu protein Com
LSDILLAYKLIVIFIKNIAQKLIKMASNLFRLQSNKFSYDNILATLVCSKCGEVFSKEFPLELEGQTIEFKCPVCNSAGETDLPYKSPEQREDLDLDLDSLEEETIGDEFEQDY